MANPNPTQKMIINLSGQGGLSQDYMGDRFVNQTTQKTFGSPRTRYNAGDDQFVAGIFNPVTRMGYSSPSVSNNLSVTTSGSYSAAMAASQLDDINEDFYFLENGTKIHMGSSFAATGTATDRTISNAVFTDACIYVLNNVRHLFFTYRLSGTSTVIGVKNLTSTTYTDVLLGGGGTMTNNFTPVASYGKLIPAGDGFLYFLNGNHVHRIDGTTLGGATGTVEEDILLAPDYFHFTHGVDYRSNLYMVIQRNTLYQTAGTTEINTNTECGVYIWNRQASFFNTSDYIPLMGVKEVMSIHISPKNTIRIFCMSSGGTPQLREYDGSKFKVIQEFEFYGYPVYEDSISVHGNFTTWLSKNGRFYTYGTNDLSGKESLSIVSDLSITSGSSILYCNSSSHSGIQNPVEGTANGHPEGFYFGYNDGTNKIGNIFPYAQQTVESTTFNKAQGDIFTPVKFLPTLCNVRHINLFMLRQPSSSGSTVQATLKFYFNQSDTSSFSKSITNDDLAKGFISIEINKPYVNSIQIEIEHAANAIGGNDFCPAYAEVIYEPTSTIR